MMAAHWTLLRGFGEWVAGAASSCIVASTRLVSRKRKVSLGQTFACSNSLRVLTGKTGEEPDLVWSCANIRATHVPEGRVRKTRTESIGKRSPAFASSAYLGRHFALNDGRSGTI